MALPRWFTWLMDHFSGSSWGDLASLFERETLVHR